MDGVKRATFGDSPCSLARALDVIGDPWTPLVLRDVAFGISRFDAIQGNLGLSRKVLAQRLQLLVDHGVVERTAYQDKPPRFDYRLTEQGKDLAMVLVAVLAYGDKWTAPEAGPPLRWRHLGCGEIATAVQCCSSCGEPLRPGEAVPERGPGFEDDAFPEITKVMEALEALA
jgi:DNA-binding HxlR family transcriptional regulator